MAERKESKEMESEPSCVLRAKRLRVDNGTAVKSNDKQKTEDREVDYTEYHVSRLVALSGFTDLCETLTALNVVNYSTHCGVLKAFKGVGSCFNPKLLYLPATLARGEKATFLTKCVSPHLIALSMSLVSSNDLLAINKQFKHLTKLHLYDIFDISNNDENESKTKTSENVGIALQGLSKLEHLTLSRFPYSQEMVTNGLCKLSNLKRLELRNARSDDESKQEFSESDWLNISKNCVNLERLELDGIYGLTDKSLEQLKSKCPKLGYFEVINCGDAKTETFSFENDNCLWYRLTQIFGKRLKGLAVWNESSMHIGGISDDCPNMEELSLRGVWATAMSGFNSFKNLKKLELQNQRYVYRGTLSEIAFECEMLEEFTYTNEFPGKHSYSHDLIGFASARSLGGCKNLKKIYTNGETCSKRMAKLIMFENPQIQVCCIYNRICIFDKRYRQKALKSWDKRCHCCGYEGEGDDCDDDEEEDDEDDEDEDNEDNEDNEDDSKKNKKEKKSKDNKKKEKENEMDSDSDDDDHFVDHDNDESDLFVKGKNEEEEVDCDDYFGYSEYGQECIEKKLYKQRRGIMRALAFDKEGNMKEMPDLFLPSNKMTEISSKVVNIVRKFNNEKFNQKIDGYWNDESKQFEYKKEEKKSEENKDNGKEKKGEQKSFENEMEQEREPQGWLDWLMCLIVDIEIGIGDSVIPNCDKCQKWIEYRSGINDDSDDSDDSDNNDNNNDRNDKKEASECDHLIWRKELRDCRDEMDDNFTSRPSLSKAMKKSVKALITMKQFDDANYNDQIDALIASCNTKDETLIDNNIHQLMSLFVKFQTEYETKQEEMAFTKEQQLWFEKFSRQSDYLFNWIAQMCGIMLPDIENAELKDVNTD